ncbi:MAG: hypothetical protein AAB425_05990 [Bdellovibrionota bacterium]
MSGRRAIGNRSIWVSMSGANRVIQFETSPVRFNFLLGPSQWNGFLSLLRQSANTPPQHDAFSGYSFTKNLPFYFDAVLGPRVVKIAGRQTRMARTDPKALAGMQRTHWTEHVTLEYGGISFFLERAFFLKLKSFCLKLDTIG